MFTQTVPHPVVAIFLVVAEHFFGRFLAFLCDFSVPPNIILSFLIENPLPHFYQLPIGFLSEMPGLQKIGPSQAELLTEALFDCFDDGFR